jgi:F0F1-type ATP synthase assembly protein I
VRFYGKKPPGRKQRKSLGDRMLEGAERRRTPSQPGRRVWLGKVLVFAAAGAAVGELVGAVLGRTAGSPGIGMSIGCALGALAGAALGGGNAVEALLGAALGGAFAFADCRLIRWGNVSFYDVARMSVLGPAGVLLGVIIGRMFTKKKQAAPEDREKDS